MTDEAGLGCDPPRGLLDARSLPPGLRHGTGPARRQCRGTTQDSRRDGVSRQRAEGQLPLGQDAASQDRAGRPGRGPSRGEPGAADGGLRHYDQGADPITTRHWVGGRMRSSSRRLGVAERRAMQLGELRQCWTRTSRQPPRRMWPGPAGSGPRHYGQGFSSRRNSASCPQ